MNSKLSQIEPSLIREIHARKRKDTIDFGLGEPVLHPPMLPIQSAMSWVAKHGLPYSPNAGFSLLRTRIAQHYRFPGMEDESSVCVTVGSQEALSTATQALLTPGHDEVLIPTPSYPLYKKLCVLHGASVKEVPFLGENQFRPSAASVLEAITPRTKMIILSSPCNPTGQVWSRAELQALSDGLSRLPTPPYVLSDEVYQEIYFTDERPASIAEYYPRTVVVNSLSKCCAMPGARLGWVLAPPEPMKAIHKVHQFSVSCAGTFAQQVATYIFQNPGYIGAHRLHYLEQREQWIQALRQTSLSFVEPEGGFYTMVRLKDAQAKSSMDTALTLLEAENVATIPGVAFGVEGYLRLSFVAAPSILREGVSRIERFLGHVVVSPAKIQGHALYR